MSLTAWDSDLGTRQGRIQPTGATPAQGEWSFVLGSDAPGYFELLNPGDSVTVGQLADWTAADLVRVTAVLRPATAIPAGVHWRFSLLVDGAEVVGQDMPQGATRTRIDMAANVANLAGDREVSFRLQLLGAGGPYLVELPAVYVDKVVLDASTGAPFRPKLINRDPEPSDGAVPVNQTIAIDIVEVGGSTVDLSGTKIWVGGVLAFDGGSFVGGFNGPEAGWSNPQPDVLRVLIDPSLPLPSGIEIPVRVVSAITADPLLSLDRSYTFITEDLAAPRLVEVKGWRQREIRATFNEGIRAIDAGAAGDVLNPGSWAIELVEGADQTRLPAVTLGIVGVEAAGPSVFILTTDIAQTPGATYEVSVEGVRDLLGNIILTENRARLLGFQPPVPPRRQFNLWDRYIPQMNKDEDEVEGQGDLRKFIGCLQEVLDWWLVDIDGFYKLIDPLLAPEPFVDLMLVEVGNPFRFAGMTLTDKRKLLLALVPMFIAKGSDESIINAIDQFLSIEVTITAFNTDNVGLSFGKLGSTFILGTNDIGTNLTFTVHVPRILTDEEEFRMRKLIEYAKRGEAHYRLDAPQPPQVIDHWALGYSKLGVNAVLHE